LIDPSRGSPAAITPVILHTQALEVEEAPKT